MNSAQKQSLATVRAGEETSYDVKRIRGEFPILSRSVYGKPLVYLDNAATAQKPKHVIDAVHKFYTEEYSNIHRGLHYLSEKATEEYENARGKVQGYINAANSSEIIFVRSATEAINLVAQTYGRKNLCEGDEILITTMEHHSNIVPWQMLCNEKGANLRVVPITDDGEIILNEFERLLNPKTKLVAVTHISNSLGTINPIKRIIEIAHARGIPVLVDGAQAVQHIPVDVQRLDADFYAFSGHKFYGPSGIGVLYGKSALLEEMPPYQGGGEMISRVTFDETTFKRIPFKFEAGTPNIAGAIGLGATVDYISAIGIERIELYEKELLDYATQAITSLSGVRIIGTAKEKASVISFVVKGVHPHDLGTILDQDGIAIRAGHHCAQPVMDRFGIPATARASFGLYNTVEEADALVCGVQKTIEVFA